MDQSSIVNDQSYKDWRNKVKLRRKELMELYVKEKIPLQILLTDLIKLYDLGKTTPSKSFDNLYKYLYNIDFLFLALEKIKPNSGILTPGIDQTTIDETELETISKISWLIKNEQWDFKPVKRIYIEKPGKKKKRPLGIPTFEDRVIQEAIRLILNVIYEPVFQEIEKNFGFRPNRSVNDAVLKITREAKSMNFAIEGDIEQAYDTVDHKIMIGILKEKVKDKKFIRFLEKSFVSGILDKGKYMDSILGVPQGGIASSILFNIYMHKFDLYVMEYLSNHFHNININEGRNSEAVSKIYQRRRANKRTSLDAMIRIKDNKSFYEMTPTEQRKYKEKKKQYEKRNSLMKHTKSKSQKKLLLRFHYTRYADDWIIFTNASETINKEIKDHFKNWLVSNLKLNLSEEKTKVTDITKRSAKFLGFRFLNNQRKMPFIKVETDSKQYTRRVGIGMFCGIDHERLINRLFLKGFIDKKNKSIANKIFIKMKPHEIVLKYRQIVEGLVQFYYKALIIKSEFARYHYYLQYSCYATLANRLKSSISKVINKYGRELNIEYTMETKSIKTGQIKKNTYRVQFPSWIRLMKTTMIRMSNSLRFNSRGEIVLKNINIINIRNNINVTKNPLDVKANIRTSFKLKKYCPLCGLHPTPSNPLQSHHVKSVRKGKFTKEIMRLLNKKQIICCKQCHIKIHQGKYDGKNLSDFYDPALLEF